MINPIEISDAPGLYVHVPFCSGKCFYCDFFSVADSNLIQTYLDSLVLETGHYAHMTEPFDTLYFGGGTPSNLNLDQIESLFETIKGQFNFADDVEITFEANPEDISVEKVKLLTELGVTRLSLGIQSLDEDMLKLIGRRHDVKQIEEAVEIVKGFDELELCLDFMYGLPDQSLNDWLDTLARAVLYKPDHLSCYQLTLESETLLAEKVKKGELAVPDEEVSRKFLVTTSEFLTERGFIHYEVSNYAASKEQISRHNSKYWHHKKYLGLGPSAHSFSGSERWWNQPSMKMYSRFLNYNTPPLAGHEKLSLEQILLEKIFLGIRTCWGVPGELIEEHGCGPKAMDEFIEMGLIKKEQSQIIATVDGLAVADQLALKLSG